MEPTLSVTNHGFLLSLDGLMYTMTWIGHVLKVTGHGVCFYIGETRHGIEQVKCSLSALSALLGGGV